MSSKLWEVHSDGLTDAQNQPTSYSYTLKYGGAKADLHGRGMLGFRWKELTDTRTGFITRVEFNQTFPTSGLSDTIITKKSDGTVIDSTSNSWYSNPYVETGGTRYVISLQQTTKETRELDGSLVSTTTTSNTFDEYGNATQITVATDGGYASGGYTKITNNTYDNSIVNMANWFLGRLTRSEVTSYLPDATQQTRVSLFAYYADSGLLYFENIEPNSSNWLYTVYEYDLFGNKDKVTYVGSDITPRITTTDFDTRSQFPTKTTNAVGHEETYVYDARFGVRTSLTGPNGFTTSWQYDGFGLKTREDRLDGSYTTWTYTVCETTCSYGEALSVATVVSDGAPVMTYFDMLGRELATETVGLNNRAIYKKTVYNNRGKVDKVSSPYFATDQIYWTSYIYGDLGRVLTENRPDGSTTTFTYAGLTTISNFTGMDGISQNSTKVKNSQGQLVEVRDHNNNPSTYIYDHFGNLLSVTDAAGNTSTMAYDIRGNKTSMTDPDMGYWQYLYNGMGELRWQKDAKGQEVSMEYDTLGRMTRRIETEGITTWRYDTYDSPPIYNTAKGKPTITTGADGTEKRHYYDNKGRLWFTVSIIDGISYVEFTSYDNSNNSSRVLLQQQPNGFTTKNIYDANGYLIQVTDTNASPTIYWQADEANARGQIMQETFGNNQVTARSYEASTGRLRGITTGVGTGSDIQYLQYSYDSIGNLSSRTDVNQDLLETFGYDDLNRLTTATIVGVGTRSYQYDAIGNITYKSDVGHYTYGEGTAGPHAVTNIDSSTVSITRTINTQDINSLITQMQGLSGPVCDTTGGSVNTQDVINLLNSSIPVSNTASTGVYTYDANGNMITGGGRNITWSSYNKPTQITRGDVTLDFNYGADRNRYKQVSTDGATTKTTIYVGGSYEKVSVGSLITHKNYIFAGGKRIAVVENTNGTITANYFHTDHLGSTDAVTDEVGALVERLSFSPFGGRRSSNWSGSSTLDSFTTSRGFTGHEHLDGVGLIHMNGRVYDPMLGRFLSADPFVQAPENAQSLNRYSYLLNNPLSGTDPSGHFWQVFVGYFLIAAAGAVIVNNIPELAPIVAIGIAIWAPFASALADGFLAGFAGSGGDVKSGVIGAVTAGMFNYANTFKGTIQSAVAHGVAGGTSSALRGGKFEQGFLSSGFAKLASPLIKGASKASEISDRVGRTLAAAVVGGTTSALGGGKFANGAQTAGFLRLFGETADYYKSKVGRSASLWPGENRPERPTYEPDPNGRQEAYDGNLNVVGDNDSISSCRQGSTCSKALNIIPGINATAGLHDYWFNSGQIQKSLVTNFPSMLPAAAISYSAIIGNVTQGWQNNPMVWNYISQD